MIFYSRAEEKIESLKNLDFALYGETRNDIRKFVINKLEGHLYDEKIICPEEYLDKWEKERPQEGLEEYGDIYFKKKDKFDRIKKKSLHKGILNDIKIRRIFGSLFLGSKIFYLLIIFY